VLINQGAGNNTIGGPTDAGRNIISSNKHNGVGVGSLNPPPDSQNIIQGNYIGLSKDGVQPLGNLQDGVIISLAGNPSLIVGNVISANGLDPGGQPRGHGVSLGGAFVDEEKPIFGGSGSVVADNLIGTDKTGQFDRGNMLNGIYVENNSFIHSIKKNVIAFNHGNGVCVPDEPGPGVPKGKPPGFQIVISQNSIFSNVKLGIDLGASGQTANHIKDPATREANNGQNFPDLIARTGDDGNTIQGVLKNSAPNKTFRIELYSNTAGSDCHQGRVFVGSVPVTTDSKGTAFISFVIPNTSPTGFINATATDQDYNTSELSPCVGSGVIRSISVSSNIIAIGSGFIDKVKLAIDDVEFSEYATLKGGARVKQKGKLTNGLSIEEAVPPGKSVLIKFINGDKTETVVPFRR
jgi:hypothetical protein